MQEVARYKFVGYKTNAHTEVAKGLPRISFTRTSEARLNELLVLNDKLMLVTARRNKKTLILRQKKETACPSTDFAPPPMYYTTLDAARAA